MFTLNDLKGIYVSNVGLLVCVGVGGGHQIVVI